MNSHARIAFLALAGTSLACSLFLGGPPPPEPGISGSPEQLQSLESRIQQALAEGTSTGKLQLDITQEELTAYLAAQLSAQAEPLFKNPMVVLHDQEMAVFGRAQSGMFEADFAATFRFSVDANGKPEIEISDADLGPVAMPQAIRDGLAATMDEALTGYIGPAAIGFRLENISISDGVMTVSGQLR
jgi:hypothetical protein